MLVGVQKGDGLADISWLAAKIARLRIFSDRDGAVNLDVSQAGGEVLAVSQFTLLASVKKGTRPSWSRAAPGDESAPLFDAFVTQLSVQLEQPVKTGIFGADMKVALINDGPVTLLLDSRSKDL